MKEWWPHVVHCGYTFADVDEDLENLCLSETFSETSIHHVDYSATCVTP
jgi:hypothetical protein